MAKSKAGGTGRPTSAPKDVLATYAAKRDFANTPEPEPALLPEPEPQPHSQPRARPSFVIQKHDATRLHYDIRLEIAGAMMSFAVPKGPSYDPTVKRFAVETEDHPIEYNSFEGRIPDGNYGAGDVLVWDRGTYETVPPGQSEAMRAKGHLKVRFFGDKLQGEWHFVKMKRDREGNASQNMWLFFKAQDGFADASRDVVNEAPASVVSGKTATRGPVRGESSLDAKELLDLVGEPMKADSVPLDDPAQYTFEIKYDGYRILAAKVGTSVRLESRRGHDWTDRFQPIADAIAQLGVRDAVVDGEVVAVTSDGTPSFHRLQQWVGGERREIAIAFAAFDLLFLDGRDLRKRPIEERRELLQSLLPKGPNVLSFSTSIPAPLDAHGKPDVPALLAMAKQAGLEGFVAKRKGSIYVGGRCPWWVKLKVLRRQEFAVCGYTPLKETKLALVGALILATKEKDGTFKYAGKVGSGFDDKQRRDLGATLEKERTAKCPIVIDERIKDARWCTPRLVAEVSFMEWSDDGKLRFPTFIDLRDDKTPDECVREPLLAEKMAVPERDREPDVPPPTSRRAVKLSNVDKVLFPRDGITKRDVVAYYEAIGPVLLPHLRGRPLTLQRWPDGIDGEEWFQQHPPQGTPSWVHTFGYEGKQHLVCDDLDTLSWLANLAALTLHGWSAHVRDGSTSEAQIADDLRHPDWMSIDLDPGEAPFSTTIEIAQAVRVLLDKLELPSFVKTTGKRGLHVLVPLARGPSHDDATRLAQHLATAVARVLPKLATVERSIPKRGGRLYVDYLQNGEGKTLAMPYVLRAVDGARVSCPLRWSEVGPTLDPSAFTLRTVLARVDAHGDLFAGVLGGGVDVRALLSRLGG